VYGADARDAGSARGRRDASLSGNRVQRPPGQAPAEHNQCQLQGSLEANAILAEIEGVAASAGAACHSDRIDVSPVLMAMGVPIEYAMGTVRLSVGRYTTADGIDSAVEQTGPW